MSEATELEVAAPQEAEETTEVTLNIQDGVIAAGE